MKDLAPLYSAFQEEGFKDVPIEDRVIIVEANLAKYLAFQLPLPSSPLDALTPWYGSHCIGIVRTVISAFNEQYPINVENVIKLTQVMWTQRYNLCHRPRDFDLSALCMILINNDNSDLTYTMPPVYKSVIGNDCPGRWLITGFVENFITNEPVPSGE